MQTEQVSAAVLEPAAGGFEDILYIRKFCGGFNTDMEEVPRKEKDIRVNLRIGFEEAVFGVSKTIKITQ